MHSFAFVCIRLHIKSYTFPCIHSHHIYFYIYINTSISYTFPYKSSSSAQLSPCKYVSTSLYAIQQTLDTSVPTQQKLVCFTDHAMSLQNCSLELGYKESQPINSCHLCGRILKKYLPT